MDEVGQKSVCRNCQSELAATVLVCPGCGAIVHSQKLDQMAAEARACTQAGDLSGALMIWREALTLVPAGIRQHQIISQKITELGQQVSTQPMGAPRPKTKSNASNAAAGAGAIALMAWKLKSLLFGLTKASTFFSMLLSMSVYWTIWGWKFALGLVLSIYVHEMGHVLALRRYGFRAGAPMFIPGLGALIRLQQQVVNPREDAEIGLAGPIYGLGAAIFSLALWWFTQMPIFAAVAGVGAWINLFNLLPLGTLDGGRGFHAMTRPQRFLAAIVVAGAWYYTSDGLLMLIAIVAIFRAIGDQSPPSTGQPDRKPAAVYIALIVILTAVSHARYLAHRSDSENILPPTQDADRASSVM